MSEPSSQPEGAREKWNRRYADQGLSALSEAPAGWLSENRSWLAEAVGRRALDVACGNGRNALYLAQLGFEVDAVDISDVAIDALRAVAADRGLPINAHRMDLEDDPLPVARYDVIAQINYLQRDLFGPVARALKPGGVLIFETLTRRHAEVLGHSCDPHFLLERNELLRSFPDLHVLQHRDAVVDGSGRPRGIASIVAQWPASP